MLQLITVMGYREYDQDGASIFLEVILHNGTGFNYKRFLKYVQCTETWGIETSKMAPLRSCVFEDAIQADKKQIRFIHECNDLIR